jgi:hypothetical protein
MVYIQGHAKLNEKRYSDHWRWCKL